MTEFIQINVDIDYPIGIHIQRNVPFIKVMGEALIKRFPDRNITFWVTGSSGAIISGIICSMIPNNTTIVYARKPHENNHHADEAVNVLPNSLNIIVDDFTRTFTSIRRIIELMNIVGVKPDCLCLGDSLHGASLFAHELDMFPVIIASKIYFPNCCSIVESCTLQLSEHAAKAAEKEN